MADLAPLRMREQRCRHEYEIEHGCGESDSFPRPVAMRHEGDVENRERAEHRKPGRNAEEAEAGTDGDELGDQRQKIPDHQVDHREAAPEGPEAVVDQLRMPAVR